MPSEEYDQSIRILLFVIVFQLGICVIVLGDVANAARGYGGIISNVAQLIGGVTAAGALLKLLFRWVPSNTGDTPA